MLPSGALVQTDRSRMHLYDMPFTAGDKAARRVLMPLLRPTDRTFASWRHDPTKRYWTNYCVRSNDHVMHSLEHVCQGWSVFSVLTFSTCSSYIFTLPGRSRPQQEVAVTVADEAFHIRRVSCCAGYSFSVSMIF